MSVTIDVSLVERLIATQFPQYAALPIKPVATSGWDNRTFHLGSEYSVRLPSAAYYAPAVLKEQEWLPRLAPQLPLAIPTPVELGQPCDDFPWHWSIYRWLTGTTAYATPEVDLPRLAVDLAEFLTALQSLDVTDGPGPGRDNALRGGPVSVWDKATRAALTDLRQTLDVERAGALWKAAMSSSGERPPVWVHGDVAAGNLLIDEGRLSAVIDFGQLVVGDPACDLVIAWTLFDASSRALFRSALNVDDATWARGRGWALWKAAIVQAGHIDTNVIEKAAAPRVLAELLAEPA